jgi:probable HAF family extracellular repeat protein
MLGPLEVRTGADPGQAVEVTGAQLRALAKVVRLRAALAGQRALLVLDNCEHLVAAAATLAVNSSGQVAGWSTAPGGTGDVAVLYTNGSIIDLGTIDGGIASVANGINNAGVVIGNSDTASSEERGFVYKNGTITDIGTLGGPNSSVDAINDNAWSPAPRRTPATSRTRLCTRTAR